MPLKQDELKSLQKIYQLFRTVELTAKDGDFPEKDLSDIAFLLSQFQNSDSLELQKIYEIQDHLHPKMSLRHFVNFLLPLERALDKNLKDDDFLVTSKDLIKPVSQKIPLTLILDNIRSAFNVGSIFRSAECFSIEKIYLCGYTATPQNEAVQKTAMGCENLVTWESSPSTLELIKKLKQQNVKIFALETAEKSTPLFSYQLGEPAAFVLGNERFGLSNEILSLADEVLSLPVYGQKNSLNVANTVAIASAEWRRQWNLRN